MNETITPTPAKSAVPFGVLFAVIMILEFMATYVMNIDPVTNPMVGTVMSVFNYLVFPIAFISLAATNFKKANFGFVSFGQVLKIGVTLCLIGGLIFALFNTAFGLIFPEYVEEILSKTRSVMLQKSPDMTAEQAEMGLSWVRKFMQPAISIPVTVVMFCFIGLIWGLLVGAIVKKDKPQSL